MTVYLGDGPPPPCYITSSSSCPVTFFEPTSMYGSPHGPDGTSLWYSSTSGPAKIPALSALDPHAFELTTPDDLNISLEGGMSSQRELHSPKTNSLTPLVASFDQSASLAPQRERDMIFG